MRGLLLPASLFALLNLFGFVLKNTEKIGKALDKLFSNDFSSMDFSGWSMDLLRPVRGRTEIMGPFKELCLAIKMTLE